MLKIDMNNKSVANIPQNLVSGIASFGTLQIANEECKKLLGDSPHSIDMIELGLRTRTTRSVGEMQKYNVKVGDIVTQFGKSANGATKSILTKITAIHSKGTPDYLGTWYKEGWTNEGIDGIKRFKNGAAAIEFELVKSNDSLIKYLDKDDGITHINVYSKGKTELGRLLSNFAHTPFKYNNEIFQSVESYWYYSKTGNLDFKDLIGYKAKECYRNKYPKNYKGSNPSKEQLKEIYKLKLQHHPNIKKLLLQNNLPLAHYYIMDGKQIDANEFLWTVKLWEEIKDELLKDKLFKILITASKDFSDYERLEKDILSIVETKDIKNLKLITDNELAIKFYQNYKEVELEKFNIENINDITNHSGGALGADSMFDTIGREYGFNNHIHYYHGNKTPLGNMKLSTEEILEGIEQAKKASRILGKSWNNKYASLLGRNWFQVKNSDIIIAIASLIHPNEEGVRGYINKTNKTVVSGGTAYAVEMAILHNKPVFVYDLKTKCWYRYEDCKYIECNVPLLTKNFAGIGSRQDNGKMSEDSIQAIRDVYERYLKYNSDIYYTLVKGVKPNLVLVYYDKKDINTKHCIENSLKLNYEVFVNYY